MRLLSIVLSEWGTTGLEKPRRQCSEFGRTNKWKMFIGGMNVKEGKTVLSKLILFREMVKELFSNLFQLCFKILTER